MFNSIGMRHGAGGGGAPGANVEQDVFDIYTTEVANDSPVLFWRLGEAAGTNANDETVNNLDGTYLNTPTRGVVGAISDRNDGITLTAANSESVTRATDALLPDSGDNVSIEIWAKWTVTTAGMAIATLRDGSNEICGIWANKGSTGDITVRYESTDLNSSRATYNDGEWHHIVLTWATDHTLKMYIDGLLSAQSTVADAGSVTAPLFEVGEDNGSGYFDGSVDDVSLYEGVLTPVRIGIHYDAGVQHLMDPDNKGAAITLSNNNKTATGSGSNWDSVVGTSQWPYGRWYWEATVDAASTASHGGQGPAEAGIDTATFQGDVTNDGGMQQPGGNCFYNNNFAAIGGTSTTADIMGVKLDLDANLWLKNKNDGSFTQLVTSATHTVALSSNPYGMGGSYFSTAVRHTFNAGATAFNAATVVPAGFRPLNGNRFTNRVLGLSCQLYAPFDEGSGTTAYEWAKGNDGTITGTPTLTNDSLVPNLPQAEGAFAIASSGDDVDFPDSADLDITDDITIGFWYKTDGAQGNVALVSKANTTPSTGYEIQLQTDGSLRFAMNAQTGTLPHDTTATTMDSTTAQFVVLVRELNGRCTWYIDGVKENENTTGTDDVVDTAISANTEVLRAGSRPDGALPWTDGEIDELFVLNIALSDDEVAHLYDIATETV